jgi:fructosamine-3-kinase
MSQSSKSPTVDDLAMEYLLGAEAGLPPDLNDLATRLPDSASQEELREIVEAAEIARSTFPVPFRLRTVIAARYQLLEELGSGGFGKVWRARDQKLGRDVALKLFHPLMDDAQLESTLRRERDALARVHHDGIVRLLDSGTHEDAQFLAMEYLPGSTLDKVLEKLVARGKARPDRAAVAAAIGGPPATGEQSWLEDDWHRTTARIMVGVLWAVAAAHSHQIHHRDLKPGNILLRPSGRPVVLDFGLAGLGDMAQGTLTGRLFGTVAYMAPEQLEVMRTGKDARTDIYQLGLVLYEMLTFQRTFAGKERTSLLEAVRRSRIPSPRQLRKDIPAALADICMHALERDPGRRYASADAFRDDLERWLAGQVPSVSRLGAAGRAFRHVRRFTVSHRAAVLATALLTLTTSTALYYALRPAPIAYTKVGDDSFDITMRGPGMVCAFLTSLNEAGKSIGCYPVRIRVGSHNPELLVHLESGTTNVKIVAAKDYEKLPGEVDTEVRWFANAADLDGLNRVADAAHRDQKPVTNDVVCDINQSLVSKGARGGSSIGLPLEGLLR